MKALTKRGPANEPRDGDPSGLGAVKLLNMPNRLLA